MKKLSLIFFALLLIGLLAACGPQRSEEGTNNENDANTADDSANTADSGNEEGAMPDKPEKLTVWMNDQESQLNAIEATAKQYTEETGIEIEIKGMAMLDMVEKLDLDGPSGNGPDIFYQPHDRIGDLVVRGLADPINLGDAADQYTDTAINAVTYDEEIWGVPNVVETYALYYNKDIVGDEAPATMEDINAIMSEYTNKSNDEYGFLAEANNFYYMYPYFAGNGGYVFANENGVYDPQDIGLANEGSVKGAELIQSWFNDGYLPKEITADIQNGLFKDGKVATIINGPWMMKEYEEALGDSLGAAPLPLLDNGENPKSFVGVKTYMLSYYSENKEWATDFMKYLTNSEQAMNYFKTAGEMPARKDALDDPAIADDQLVSAFAEQATYGEPMPSIPQMQQVWDPMNAALQFIAKGDNVEDVLTEAVGTIKDNIAASGQ
ncbi:extracellular solute-binding protein [Aquibacillus salsiterrae]|uniref:Maltodextrin-binding protein n=1 Tax=Aquibacillus salsiterrae TaxID=2950439 RepID=A0A9X4AG52_9BACI|nr:extracellular solute-binding protein [Aquibacillus salsiterrae]MDC3418586.1 extracellular solute-binding protein [Aquibacillus salsiterrae]